VAYSLKDFAQNISDEIAVSLPVGKQENVVFAKSSAEVNGSSIDTIDEKADLNLMGQRVPMVRRYYRVDGDDRVLLMFHQTTSEDGAKVNPGFELILRTVKLTPTTGS
jgi:hypothetical protein